MSAPRRQAPPVLRRAALAVEEAPEAGWAAQLLHHGARLLLLIATAATVYLFFPAPRVPDVAVLERGDVSMQDVVAEFPFVVYKTETELNRERAEAASGVPPVLDFLPGAADEMIGAVRNLFLATDSVIVNTEVELRRDAVRGFLARERIYPTVGALSFLLNAEDRRGLRLSMEVAIRDFFPRGVVASAVPRDGVSTYRVRGLDGAEVLLSRDSVITPDRFFTLAAGRLPEGARPEMAELQRLVLVRYFQPSLAFNEQETEIARQRAREAVDPVREDVMQGQRIVGAHERVGDQAEQRLRAYRNAMIERGMTAGGYYNVGLVAGAMLYNALVLAILGVLLFLFRRPLYHDFRSVLLVALLVIAVMGAGALIARLGLAPELIPVAFAALIIAGLWDGRLALVTALLLAMLIAGQSPFLGLTAPFSALLGGAAAAFSVGAVHRRSKTWVFITVISVAYAAAAITMGLMRSREFSDIMTSVGWGAVNAIVASLLAIGFLPLLEIFARITTEQTLLELSDLNRKLLKRLSFEASGTYHHAINVANLAEASCHAIGANGLLARVGAYYHDIGKLVKPQYFIENQPKGRNPHDKLKPAMSASIIRSHVTEGLRLAEEERLPGVVRDFIAQHHGTQQISFFLEKARELDPDGHINASDFAYPGPRPRTRETAVLMLADSVESAARVLQDPTPERLRDLVERIVAGKIANKQLDESPLTLRDIQIVKQQLAYVLNGMYHHRIDYPPQPTLQVPPPAPDEAAAVNLASAG
jgi:cyclic-di-AMP phosphodiesterase PgpH